MRVGQLVSFLYVKNTSGYPMVGQITKIVDDKHVNILAYGIYGPGSTGDVTDVPIDEIKLEEFTLNGKD